MGVRELLQNGGHKSTLQTTHKTPLLTLTLYTPPTYTVYPCRAGCETAVSNGFFFLLDIGEGRPLGPSAARHMTPKVPNPETAIAVPFQAI